MIRPCAIQSSGLPRCAASIGRLCSTLCGGTNMGKLFASFPSGTMGFLGGRWYCYEVTFVHRPISCRVFPFAADYSMRIYDGGDKLPSANFSLTDGRVYQ